MRKFWSAVLSAAALALLAGCQAGTPAQPGTPRAGLAETEEPTTVRDTGRQAFQKLFMAARMWARDEQPFRLQSEPWKDSAADGKAVIWRGDFASASRRTIKSFVWSGSHAQNAPPYGVSSSAEDTYNPSNVSTRVFDASFLKIDSDQAFAVAQKHGGGKLLKANAKQPVFYMLDWNTQENGLVWHVIYGTSQAQAKLRVLVNATTGAFERVEK